MWQLGATYSVDTYFAAQIKDCDCDLQWVGVNWIGSSNISLHCCSGLGLLTNKQGRLKSVFFVEILETTIILDTDLNGIDLFTSKAVRYERMERWCQCCFAAKLPMVFSWYTANISDSNESQIPYFSEFCLRILKLSIQEKMPDRPLEKPLKLIRDISEKSGQVPDKIPHKCLFSSIIRALFFFRAKIELFLFTQFQLYSSL